MASILSRPQCIKHPPHLNYIQHVTNFQTDPLIANASFNFPTVAMQQKINQPY